MNNAFKRIDWIDICKFFSIALVVWLHFGIPQKLDGLVHEWHMPIFYLLSGLCFNFEKHSDFCKFLLSRFRTLLIPYLLFSVVLYSLWSVIYMCVSPQSVVPLNQYLKCLFFFNTTSIPNLWGAVQWFLTSLFFTEILFWVCFRIAKSCSFIKDKSIISLCISIILACIGFLYAKTSEFRLPLALDTVFPMLFFFSLGNYIRGKKALYSLKDASLWKKVIFLVASGGICFVFYLLNGDTNVRQLKFNNPVLFCIGATAGCVMMIVFSMMICDSVMKKYKVFKGLLYIGQGTIIVLYVHRLYIGLLSEFVFSHIYVSHLFFVYTILTIVFLLIFAYPSCYLVNKYCPFLLGKWYKM